MNLLSIYRLCIGGITAILLVSGIFLSLAYFVKQKPDKLINIVPIEVKSIAEPSKVKYSGIPPHCEISVSGSIVNSAKKPISDAIVEVNGKEVGLTDLNGKFRYSEYGVHTCYKGAGSVLVVKKRGFSPLITSVKNNGYYIFELEKISF